LKYRRLFVAGTVFVTAFIVRQGFSNLAIILIQYDMSEQPEWKQLTGRLLTLFETDNTPDRERLRAALKDESAVDITLAMDDLTEEQAMQVFKSLHKGTATEVLAKLDQEHTEHILARLDPQELKDLLEPLPAREAAIVLSDASDKQLESLMENSTPEAPLTDVQHRLDYPKGSAGRIMTTEFIALDQKMTIAEALQLVKQTDPDIDIPSDLYVVEGEGKAVQRRRLHGVISIRSLLMCNPEQKVKEVMATDVVSVLDDVDEEDVAALLSKYKFSTMPVTDAEGYLVGVIPADDLMPVIAGRLRHLYNQAVGTDAEVMERLTPAQAAKVRVPWLLGTMAIELGAGLIISHYDAVLQKVILLASFMPVISAVSGNVGLQAAAITVRALDAGSRRKNLWGALRKEGATSLLMAIVCGVVLGAIGAIWAKQLPFGIVIGAAIICSMLTAGLMGTVIPIVSKRFGFDPATTAGPFETAFQDVIGFAVFLGLATLFQDWMV